MAVQNKTTYQTSTDSNITTNGVQAITGSVLNSNLDNLSDSVPFRKSNSSLGVDPTAWNVNSFERAVDSCQLNGNASIAISNSLTQGVYHLGVRKGGATDITVAFTESGITFNYDNAASSLLLTGALDSYFLIKVVRIGTNAYVSCSMNDVLDEDDMASDSADKAPSQQSVKAYVLANAGSSEWDSAATFTGSSGTEVQNQATSDITGQTSTAAFTFLDVDIDDTARASTGTITFIDYNVSSGGGFTWNETALFSKTDTSFYLRMVDGTASNPTYSFTDDQNTGMWGNGADELYLSVGGTTRLTLTTTDTTFLEPINLTSAGVSVSIPPIRFGNDTDTGIYRSGVNELAFTTGATQAGYFDASQNLHVTNIAYVGSFTVAGLPSASTAAGIIYVSDETGGATLAFSDGTNWRRVQDRAVVS